MRSSTPLLALTLLILAGPAQAASTSCPPKGLSVSELTNPFLGPEYAQWLVGPIGCLLTAKEIEAFLQITSEEEAARFVERFWEERPVVKAIYDQRAQEADKRFREGTYVGHKTDRGTIFVIYGEPEEIFYEEFRDVSGPDVEQWKYPKKAERGLDGKRPRTSYRFARTGDVTTFYKSTPAQDPRRRLPDRRPNSLEVPR